MNPKIEKIIRFRQFLLQQVEHLTPEQLNTIPPGFNNNIIWNLAHLLATQQTICYMRAGLPIKVSDEYFSPYRPGTKPAGLVSAEDIATVKSLLISTMEAFQHDYDRQLFGQYTPNENILRVYGISLNNIDDALEFILFHEGMHTGSILALKHLLP